MLVKVKMKKLLLLLGLGLLLKYTDASCPYGQGLVSGGGTDCHTVYPNCESGDGSTCLSGLEGMFFVTDLKVGVESCQNIHFPSDVTDHSPYFADTHERTGNRCGADGANGMDDVGCTDGLKENGAPDGTSVISTITNSKTTGAAGSSTLSDCSMCSDSSTCTMCSGKLLAGGACTDAGDDSNCKQGSSDKAVGTHGADGFVLSGGTGTAKTCQVANGNDCSSSSATDCTTCKESFFSSSSTEGSSCIGNGLDGSDATTGNVGKPGYVLASDSSSCLSEGPNAQYPVVTKLTTLVGDAVDKRVGTTCDTSCEKCIGNSATQCTKGSLGKYLSITDSSLKSGSGLDKAAYSSNNEINIFVSNAAADYAKATTDHLGTQAAPDIDLMIAIARAKDMVAPYSSMQDGSILKINIMLYKGTHYTLKNSVRHMPTNIDFYGANYELKVRKSYNIL